MADDVLLGVDDRVATLTFNRPERLNALSAELLEGSIRALEQWSRDPEIGAIVVTGAGRAFCAGGDLAALAKREALPLEQDVDRLRAAQEIAWLLYSIPKVTIALVNGHAMGAGLGIALSCDLRFAAETAKFGAAYAKVGFGG